MAADGGVDSSRGDGDGKCDSDGSNNGGYGCEGDSGCDGVTVGGGECDTVANMMKAVTNAKVMTGAVA